MPAPQRVAEFGDGWKIGGIVVLKKEFKLVVDH